MNSNLLMSIAFASFSGGAHFQSSIALF
jgi:hypothetical protein